MVNKVEGFFRDIKANPPLNALKKLQPSAPASSQPTNQSTAAVIGTLNSSLPSMQVNRKRKVIKIRMINGEYEYNKTNYASKYKHDISCYASKHDYTASCRSANRRSNSKSSS